MSQDSSKKDMIETLATGAALLMLLDIGHTIYTQVVDRDKVKAMQMELVRNLKENHYEVLGLIAEKATNLGDALGNALDAAPLSQFLKDKMTTSEALKKLHSGDHIAVLRSRLIFGRYTHHGIFDGAFNVIEYGSNGLLDKGRIREVSLQNFLGSSGLLMKVDSSMIYSPSEVLRRASSKLGEQKYNLLFNNCENFARWCRGGASMM